MSGINLKPKFIELPEMKMIGIGAKFISILSPEKNNMTVIPQLWQTFLSQIGTVPGKTSDVGYGLIESLPDKKDKSHHDEMFYIACTEVDASVKPPKGMIERTIPAGRYACFTHKGPLEGLLHSMNYVYGIWLAKADVELRNAPHLELYDQRFEPGTEDSEFDILLPIK